MCLLFHKRQWFKFTIWCCCHIWGTWTERIRHEGTWKSNLESNYSSESKRSREFLKAMSLEKWVVAQIQHNGLNHFDKSSSASWKCITPAIGSLEHFYEEPSPLLYFSGQKRRKRALDLIANPQEWLFSHFYKHLVSMEGGYLAANIGNQGHSTPTISSTIARRKKKSIRLLWLGTLWEDFFKSECLKIPWTVGMCKSRMGENRHLTLFWKHLHFSPKWEHLLIQEPFAKNKVIVFFLIHNRTQHITYSAPSREFHHLQVFGARF